MSNIPPEEAADSVQAREDAIREASADMDASISALCNIFNLPSVLTEGWGALLAKRIADQHKAHLAAIRQTLRLDSHNLRMFHARPSTDAQGDDADSSSPPSDGNPQPSGAASTSGDALPAWQEDPTRCAAARVVALAVEAVKRSRKVESLYKEFDDLQSTLMASGVLAFPDILFIRNAQPDLVKCRDRLIEDAAMVQNLFATYKKCFYLLSDEAELNKLLRLIRGSAITADVFAAILAPAVRTLQRLARERAEAVAQAVAIGEQLMIDWLSLPDTHVDHEEFNLAVAQFDPLQTLVTEQTDEHNDALMCITVMFEVALNTPTSVLFSGDEIDVDVLFAAFTNYEKLTEVSREMIEASGPVIETLNEFITHLRVAVEPPA